MQEKIEKALSFKKIHRVVYPFFWFMIGFIITAALLSGFCLMYFRYKYNNRVIPGVFIGSTYVGGKTKAEVTALFNKTNTLIGTTTLTFSGEGQTATVAAKTLDIGYDTDLLSEQSIELGKTQDVISNIFLILNSYINGTYLSPSYSLNEDALKETILPISKQVYIEPVDALFTVNGNRVSAFQQSVDGKSVNFTKLENEVRKNVPSIVKGTSPHNIRIAIPIQTVHPKITTDKANNLGIVEEIGEGHSLFQHSAPERIHNVELAANRINGVLVAPGEIFSFDKNLGDVSAYTGYQQAYVIENGHTVLGDGGGVCQVSTTLFRAILNAGLPITERHAHAYRVGYYEEDSPPGIDATVYVPTVDLKFKNDTGHYILIQSYVDPVNLALSFTLYGTSDGRRTTLSTPIVTNQTPPPPPLYQYDPTLPVGQKKQVDFAASGAHVTFHRTVTKNDKVIISEDYTSNYAPWQAVFLRGTKT
jgi:vancomycin resistance protein YoaR